LLPFGVPRTGPRPPAARRRRKDEKRRPGRAQTQHTPRTVTSSQSESHTTPLAALQHHIAHISRDDYVFPRSASKPCSSIDAPHRSEHGGETILACGPESAAPSAHRIFTCTSTRLSSELRSRTAPMMGPTLCSIHHPMLPTEHGAHGCARLRSQYRYPAPRAASGGLALVTTAAHLRVRPVCVASYAVPRCPTPEL